MTRQHECIMCCVTEIIELNFFKLNENTTKNILEREEIEKEEQNEDEQKKE